MFDAEPGPLEARAFECTADMLTCRVSIYAERAVSLLEPTRIAVADAVESLEGYTSYYERLGDVVRAGDRMAVLVHPQPDSIACASAPPAELHFFDFDGTRAATATVAPCTWRIAASSDRIVAAEGNSAALSLYDFDGRWIARRPVDLAVGFPAALVIEGDSIVTAWLDMPNPNRIAFHSLAAFELQRSFETDANTLRDLVVLDEDRLLALDGEQSLVILYDAVDGARLGTAPINSTTPPVTDLFLLPERGELLVTAGGTGSAGVYSVQTDLVSARRNAPSPDTDAQAHAVSPWPADRSRVLVSMRDRNDTRALAALYDLQSGLIVPGAIEIGSGPSRSTAIDPEGRVWISLAWGGELAIVAPE
jgi:hypothetical protein